MGKRANRRKDRPLQGQARPLRPDDSVHLTPPEEPNLPSQDYCPGEGNCEPALVKSTSFLPVLRKGHVDTPPKRALRLPVLMRAPKYIGEAGLIAHHWAKRVPRCFTSDEEMRLFQMAAYVVAERGWYSIYSHTRAVVEEDLLSEAERECAKLEVMENIHFSSIKHIAWLLLSTKVSFFEKGHHTGTPFLSGLVEIAFDMGSWCGYSFATLRAVDDGRAKRLTETIWITGNWICTHGAFSAWKDFPQIEGVSSSIPRLSSAVLEPLAKQMLDRLNGPPAGTESIFNISSVLDVAKSTKYEPYFRGSESQASLEERDRVKWNPFSYHLESEWLIGKEKESPLVLSSDFVALVSAFVHGFMPGSGIARARCFLPEEMVVGMDLYKLIQHDRHM